MGMTLLKGDAPAADIIRMAYGMEEAIRQFYTFNATSTDDLDVAALLEQLADFETTHKDRLFDLYQAIEDIPVDRQHFEADVVANFIEGGFSTDEFNAQNRSALSTPTDLLSLAMMLEAQAMDLYRRHAGLRTDPEGKTILNQIADEEKAHLCALGDLLEQKS